MYFYHGNKQYYLTRIFLNDKDLQELVYSNGLTDNDKYELFSYTLADELYSLIEDHLIDSGLSATEFYSQEYEKYLEDHSYISRILNSIQIAIYDSYERTYPWYYPTNEDLYIGILKAILYGSIKHFFFEHRDKYLPQYDWYLINQNDKRKDIMDMLFREFDKLTNVADALRHYQDVDDIPFEFAIFLQEITGLTMNTYGGIFTDLQLRSLTKHLIDVWREKGALFSIELFFACMGIDCSVQELWFDRRLYFNPDSFNDYTKVQNNTSFGYYLTPQKPHTTSYSFSSETIDYADYTDPHSSRIWDREIKSRIGTEDILPKLLGFEDGADITYTFFKSNYLLINFSYIGQSKSVSKEELSVYKELIAHVLPAFIRTYYGNEYESTYGNEQWDIFKWYNPIDNGSNTYGTYKITDANGDERPAEIFDLFDTNSTGDKYLTRAGGLEFVSGTRTWADDGSEEFSVDFTGDDNWGSYIVVEDLKFLDIITGKFYNTEHSYELTSDDTLTRDDGEEGKLEFAVENGTTHYYFKVNNSREEIYPSSGFEPQTPWKYDGESLETFNSKEYKEHLNLFESSRWNVDINAYNDLYGDNNQWNGDIQYEYTRYTNPLESLEADLEADLEITLI